VDRAEDAADVVAETFLVAWRRLDSVPGGDEARLWLYAVGPTTAREPGSLG
jgi:RNA polymerase sigma-70 factor (ECF subfamily)